MWIDGWIETGDLVRLEDGGLAVLSRIEETFVVSGEIIYAFDLEDQCVSFSYIQDAAAVNIEGECHLFITSNLSDSGAATERIRSDLENISSRFKGIAEIHSVTQMPKTINGKITKDKLAAMLRKVDST